MGSETAFLRPHRKSTGSGGFVSGWLPFPTSSPGTFVMLISMDEKSRSIRTLKRFR